MFELQSQVCQPQAKLEGAHSWIPGSQTAAEDGVGEYAQGLELGELHSDVTLERRGSSTQPRCGENPRCSSDKVWGRRQTH